MQNVALHITLRPGQPSPNLFTYATFLIRYPLAMLVTARGQNPVAIFKHIKRIYELTDK